MHLLSSRIVIELDTVDTTRNYLRYLPTIDLIFHLRAKKSHDSSVALKFHTFEKSLNIILLYELIVLGIEIALSQVKEKIQAIDDKAKPRAIVGRKATGPLGIAGLPKSDEKEPDYRGFTLNGNPVFVLGNEVQHVHG